MSPILRLALAASLLMLALAACSGGKPGASGGNVTACPKQCPNDPPYASADIADCTANLQDPACGAQARALYACIDAHLACTASGTTDDAALMASCGQYKGAWEDCQTADAGAD